MHIHRQFVIITELIEFTVTYIKEIYYTSNFNYYSHVCIFSVKYNII